MRRWLGWMLLVGCVAHAAGAAPVIEVYDGDTFRVTVPAPRGGVAETRRIRPLGYDAAERHEPCESGRRMDRRATAALAALLDGARVVRIIDSGRMSFDRRLARVEVDGRDLAGLMIGAGLGRVWRRGLPGWCDDGDR